MFIPIRSGGAGTRENPKKWGWNDVGWETTAFRVEWREGGRAGVHAGDGVRRGRSEASAGAQTVTFHVVPEE